MITTENIFLTIILGWKWFEAHHCLHLLLRVVMRAIPLRRVELMTREGPLSPTPHMEPMQTNFDDCRFYGITHTFREKVSENRDPIVCGSTKPEVPSCAVPRGTDTCQLHTVYFSNFFSTVCVHACMCVLGRKLHILLQQSHIPLWSDLQQYL